MCRTGVRVGVREVLGKGDLVITRGDTVLVLLCDVLLSVKKKKQEGQGEH